MIMKALPLNLVYLKYFCDAVRHSSISLSAKENYVSQSAISQGIAKLEQALGKELILHRSNRFRVTHDGQMVFESAKAIFESMRDLENTLHAKDGEIFGKIEFACTHSFALAILPEFLVRMKKEWPNIHINFRLAHTDVIKELLKKGLIDFGIVLDNEDFSSFSCRELYCGNYGLYVAKNSNNEDLPFILSEQRLEINTLKAAYQTEFKKEMNVLMEVSSWEVIASLTEAGLGIGFFPDYVALRRNKYLKPYELDLKPIQYRIFAILEKSRKIPKTIELFLDRLFP